MFIRKLINTGRPAVIRRYRPAIGLNSKGYANEV